MIAPRLMPVTAIPRNEGSATLSGEPRGDEGRDVMRVTSWNCSRGAKTDGSLALLAPLRADLVALQECRRPGAEDASVIWRGADPRQGAAVVSTSPALPIEAIEIPSLHPTVVPVVVQARNRSCSSGSGRIRPTMRWPGRR